VGSWALRLRAGCGDVLAQTNTLMVDAEERKVRLRHATCRILHTARRARLRSEALVGAGLCLALHRLSLCGSPTPAYSM
jgi:hypothetical protein